MSKTLFVFLILIASLILVENIALSETKKPEDNVNYFIEGLKHRSEGNCEEAIKSYQMARKSKLFKEDWAYHLAVADCYVALRKYDDAIDAYTKVIDSTKNKSLQAEMYKGRGRAYYFKAVRTADIDKKLIEHAGKDLQDAKKLGAEISDIEKNMAEDIAMKPLNDRAVEESKSASHRIVSIIESANKMVAGDGEYVIYLSGDTVIKDKSGLMIPVSEIKSGDIIDFTFVSSYRNRADGMLHCAVNTITLNRSTSGKAAIPEGAGKIKDDSETAYYIKMMLQRLDRIDGSLKEIIEMEKQNQAKKEIKPVVKPKPKKKKPRKKPASEIEIQTPKFPG